MQKYTPGIVVVDTRGITFTWSIGSGNKSMGDSKENLKSFDNYLKLGIHHDYVLLRKVSLATWELDNLRPAAWKRTLSWESNFNGMGIEF